MTQSQTGHLLLFALGDRQPRDLFLHWLQRPTNKVQKEVVLLSS